MPKLLQKIVDTKRTLRKQKLIKVV